MHQIANMPQFEESLELCLEQIEKLDDENCFVRILFISKLTHGLVIPVTFLTLSLTNM